MLPNAKPQKLDLFSTEPAGTDPSAVDAVFSFSRVAMGAERPRRAAKEAALYHRCCNRNMPVRD
jgi:hypothetical protein